MEDNWEDDLEDDLRNKKGVIDLDHLNELGDFHSLVHCQDLSRKIRIRLEFDIKSEQLENLNGILRQAMKSMTGTYPESAWIEMITGWDEKQQDVYLDSYTYALNGEEWICLTMNRSKQDEAEWHHEGQFVNLNIYSKNFSLSEWMKDLSWLLDTNNSEGKKIGLNERKLKNIRPWLEQWIFEDRANYILKDFHNIVLEGLKDIRHLGPVRDVPRRDSDLSDQSGPMGLWAWRNLKQDLQLQKKTNRYMKDVLKLGYSIRQSEDREHEIQLYDETHKIYLHPLDVGFGVSQVIPVLVGALESSCQLFAVEQPELHLHPAAQVALGDLFIDCIKYNSTQENLKEYFENIKENYDHPAIRKDADRYIDNLNNGARPSEVLRMFVKNMRESPYPNIQNDFHKMQTAFRSFTNSMNRTMLIETHSEHLLLRIMRRMRETFEDRIEENRFPVTPDDVAVLFVEWHDSQTIIREMPVNKRGELVKAWPGGFFEEDIEEVFA